MSTANLLAFEPADASAARELAAALSAAGVETRALSDELAAPEASTEAVVTAGAIIPLLTPAAAASDGMRRAVSLALANGRPVVPVLAADIAPESWLSVAVDHDLLVDIRPGVTGPAVAELARALSETTGKGRVVAMLNIKGGVGKTVLAANLFTAAHLAANRSIAFIDLDPQHNLTQYFLPPAERNRIRAANQTIYSVLVGSGPSAAEREAFARLAVPLNRSKRAGKPRFELITGDERLFEYTLDNRSERQRAEAFARFHALIQVLRTRVDAIVIDANPCATFLTRLAIAAADHIVAPVRPEKYSLTGLNMLEHVVTEIRGRRLKPDEFSVLLNGVNDRVRSRAGEDADAATRAEISAAPFFGSSLLPEAVPYSGALKATPSDRYAVNPINVTAMMRVASREVKASLAGAAAAILKRAEA